MFIRDDIDRELHSLERLELKFGLSSEFFDKIPVVLYRVFREQTGDKVCQGS